MNLIHRPVVRDLHLPNGALVKVEVSEDARRQHVHDQYGRIHGTARPDPIRITVHMNRPTERRGWLKRLGKLRADLKPTQGRRRWVQDDDLRLWAPLPDDCLVEA